MVASKSSKASVVIIVIIVVAAIIVSVVVYYFLVNNGKPEDDGPKKNFCLPEIISEKATRSRAPPPDTYTVEVVVKNNGGDGFVKVFAEINAFGEEMEKSERIFLEHTGQKSVEFVFNLDPWTKDPPETDDPGSFPYPPPSLPYPTDGVYPEPTPAPTPTPITYSTWALAD